jgi:hypothetical protein
LSHLPGHQIACPDRRFSLSASLLLRAFEIIAPRVVRDQPQLRICYQNQARQFEHIKTVEETCANRALSSGATFTAGVVLAPSCHQFGSSSRFSSCGKNDLPAARTDDCERLAFLHSRPDIAHRHLVHDRAAGLTNLRARVENRTTKRGYQNGYRKDMKRSELGNRGVRLIILFNHHN